MSLYPAPPASLPVDMIADGAAFCVQLLERFGELPPLAFTRDQAGEVGVLGGFSGRSGNHEDALARLYGALEAQAQAIVAAAVFTLGEDQDGRDLLVCFCETREGGAARAGVGVTWIRPPWTALGLTLRRGRLTLGDGAFAPIERRLWTVQG